MRFGVQMYGLNPLFLQDKIAFLKRVAKAGVRYMEPLISVSQSDAGNNRLWLPQDLEENMPLLKEYGFSIPSCHLVTKDLLGDLDAFVELAKKYDIPQFIMNVPVYESQNMYKDFISMIDKAASRLEVHDIELLLHNCEGDSVLHFGDISAYEWVLNQCSDLVKSQADVGWLLYGGTNPETFLWRHENRVRSFHYKDFEKTESGLAEAAIGHGLVDMTACFQFARAKELIQLLDQDTSKGDFLDDVEDSAGILWGLTQVRDNSKSILCVMDIETGKVTELQKFDYVIEAPNWYQQDTDYMFYNRDGRIYRYQVSTGESVLIESGECINCNNDHVISPDGKTMAVSHSGPFWKTSKVYTFPIEGGTPKLITPNEPSFLHGWSPDGTKLTYCAFRVEDGVENVDIYTIGAEGGEETRLTKDAGFNDGPEYSPDGEHIWFISTRSGLMQNYCMKKDGTDQKQMTFSKRNNWFGHISPDGKKVVYLSYSKDGLDPNEHLPNMPVQLGLMNFDGSDDHVILDFFGGQGSINVNSWHPDSKRFAFVKYELEHK